MWLFVFIIVLCIIIMIIHKNKRKQTTLGYAFFQPNKIPSEKERKKQIQEHLHKDIGNTKPICPYCNKALPSFPTRKTTCKECKNPIFVVKRPFDSKTVLTTEKGKNILNTDRDNVKYYFWQDDFFEYEKQLKKMRNGGYTPPSDVYWYKLQCKALIASVMKDYQELKMIYFYRGRELLKYKSYEDALKCFLQVCYIGACGGSHDGFVWKSAKDLTDNPFGRINPETNFHFFGGGADCIINLGLTEDEVVKFFMETDFEQLPYPIEKSFFIPSIRACYKEMMNTYERTPKINTN